MKTGGICIFLTCCVGILGTGLFALPTAAVYFAQTFYWGVILAAGAVVLAVAVLFGGAGEGTFCTACIKALPRSGKWLAWGYVLVYSAVAACMLAYLGWTVQNWFLEGAPRLLLALFLNAVCLYTAAKPTKTVLRLLAFLGVFLILTIVVMRFVLLFSGDVRNLLPVTEGVSVSRLPGAAAFVSAFFILLGCIGVLEGEKKTKQRAAVWAVCVSSAIFILATAGCISMLGTTQTSRHLNSAVLAMKNLNLSQTDFIERGDMVFIVTWSFLVPSVGTLATHIPRKSATELLPNVGQGWVCAVLYLLFCIVAVTLKNQETALLALVYTSLVGGAVVLVLLPLILRFAQRRKKQ